MDKTATEALIDEELERRVLGTFFLDPNIVREPSCDISVEDLAIPTHKHILREILISSEEGQPFDPFSIQRRLTAKRVDVEIVYMSSLTEGTIKSGELCAAHIRSLKDFARRRALLHRIDGLASAALDLNRPLLDTLTSADLALQDLRSSASVCTAGQRKGLVPPSSLVPDGDSGVKWLVPGIINTRSRGMFVAAPKAGKSFLSLDLAIALSTKGRWLGFFPAEREVRCAVISREDNADLVQSRLKQLAKGRGLTLSDLDRNLRVNTRSQSIAFYLDNESHVAEMIAWLRDEQIEFAIFDVLNRLHSSEENSPTEMTRIMGVFDRISAESGAQVSVIHHLTANATTGKAKPRGASSIDSWWDWQVSVMPLPENDHVKTINFRTKAGLARPSIEVTFYESEDSTLSKIKPAVRRTDG